MKLIHYPTYVQCPICKKQFKTDLYLRRHVMSSHEGAKYNAKNNENNKSGQCNNSGDIKYELRSAS